MVFMENWMQKVGCRPTHWKSHRMKNRLPVCSNATQMKQFSRQPRTADIESFEPPCKQINRLDYIYRDLDFAQKG